ncbi:MAG: hypothetical protein GF401_10490 [Chitinivibrionales bacterium]|nr:hypothetical protein [Chitinivibrionales bacterium]
MRANKNSILRGILTGWCLIGMFLTCVSPTNVEEDEFPIMIYLDELDKTTATFSGNPVKVIIIPNDSLYFSDLNWNMGEARFLEYPYAGSEEKYRRMEVELTWLYTPQNYDSAKGMAYDTVFVTVGGEKLRSNVVKVYVYNIPPVIYEIKVNSTKLSPDFDVVEYKVESTSVCTISVVANDYDDANTYDVTWYAASDTLDTLRPIEPFTSRLASRKGSLNYYTTPGSYFRDTVYIQAYDGDGGHARKTLILYRLSPNTSPVIDSVRVDSTTFWGSSGIFRYRKLSLDTMALSVFARDADQDTLTYTWLARNSTALSSDTTHGSYICPASNCSDTLRTTVIVDTIKIAVTDPRNNSDTVAVQVVHGDIPPVIDSMSIGDTTTQRDTIDINLFQGDTLTLRIYTSDTDPWDSVTTTWVPFTGPGVSVTAIGDTGARYIAKDSTYTDRILVTSTDGVFDTGKAVFINVFNNDPVLDSISVSGGTDTTFTSDVSLYSYAKNGADTLVLKAYAADPDTVHGDSVGYAWLNDATEIAVGDTATFVCKDSTYADTLSLRVTDSKDGLVEKYIEISVTGSGI